MSSNDILPAELLSSIAQTVQVLTFAAIPQILFPKNHVIQMVCKLFSLVHVLLFAQTLAALAVANWKPFLEAVDFESRTLRYGEEFLFARVATLAAGMVACLLGGLWLLIGARGALGRWRLDRELDGPESQSAGEERDGHKKLS